nr:choice-of-anchor Q domain-containing protein [Leucobacter luti]
MGLWELAENGGQAFRDGSTILTHLPATSSVLVDSAAAAAATATDQRGVARPQGPAPDRGAVEVVLNEVSAMLGLDGSARVTAGKPATLTASRTGSSAGEVSATVRLSGGAAARAADGAAIAGTDYVDDTIVVRWADGETADQTFTIKTLARGEAGTRTLTATLEDPSGNAVLGDDTSATVTIVERAAASTDPAEPTDPSEPGTAQPPAGGTDGLATTGGESPAAWFALAAALAAAGGATLVASRRSARSRV